MYSRRSIFSFFKVNFSKPFDFCYNLLVCAFNFALFSILEEIYFNFTCYVTMFLNSQIWRQLESQGELVFCFKQPWKCHTRKISLWPFPNKAKSKQILADAETFDNEMNLTLLWYLLKKKIEFQISRVCLQLKFSSLWG